MSEPTVPTSLSILPLQHKLVWNQNHPCDYYDNGINSKDILEIFIWLEGGYYLNIIQSIPSELLRDIAWNAPDPIKHR